MDVDNPREQTAPPPDKRPSARVPILLAVSGVVLATAVGTIATVSAAPKTNTGQAPNTRVQVNPYTGQTVGTSQTTTTNDPTSPDSTTQSPTSTSTTAPTTTRRLIVTTTSGPHGITTVTIPVDPITTTKSTPPTTTTTPPTTTTTTSPTTTTPTPTTTTNPKS